MNNTSDSKEIVKQLRRLNHILEAAFNLKLTDKGYIKETK